MSSGDLYRLAAGASLAKRRELLNGGETRYPTAMYRYISVKNDPAVTRARFADILVRSKLRLSAPVHFNDPFDARLRVIVSGSAGDRKKHILDVLKRAVPPHAKKLSYKERERKAHEIMVGGDLRARLQAAYDNLLTQTGVCCFASDARSILMWSHYASSHKGVCVVFSVAKGFEPLVEALPVDYNDEYPMFDRIAGDPGINGLLTKFRCWEYEGERRIVRLGQPDTEIDVPAVSIVAVILGCAASSETVAVLQEVLAEREARGLPAVKILRAHRHPERYELQLRAA